MIQLKNINKPIQKYLKTIIEELFDRIYIARIFFIYYLHNINFGNLSFQFYQFHILLFVQFSNFTLYFSNEFFNLNYG